MKSWHCLYLLKCNLNEQRQIQRIFKHYLDGFDCSSFLGRTWSKCEVGGGVVCVRDALCYSRKLGIRPALAADSGVIVVPVF